MPSTNLPTAWRCRVSASHRLIAKIVALLALFPAIVAFATESSASQLDEINNYLRTGQYQKAGAKIADVYGTNSTQYKALTQWSDSAREHGPTYAPVQISQATQSPPLSEVNRSLIDTLRPWLGRYEMNFDIGASSDDPIRVRERIQIKESKGKLSINGSSESWSSKDPKYEKILVPVQNPEIRVHTNGDYRIYCKDENGTNVVLAIHLDDNDAIYEVYTDYEVRFGRSHPFRDFFSRLKATLAHNFEKFEKLNTKQAVIVGLIAIVLFVLVSWAVIRGSLWLIRKIVRLFRKGKPADASLAGKIEPQPEIPDGKEPILPKTKIEEATKDVPVVLPQNIAASPGNERQTEAIKAVDAPSGSKPSPVVSEPPHNVSVSHADELQIDKKLLRLKGLFEKGLISSEDYNSEKRKILDKL